MITVCLICGNKQETAGDAAISHGLCRGCLPRWIERWSMLLPRNAPVANR